MKCNKWLIVCLLCLVAAATVWMYAPARSQVKQAVQHVEKWAVREYHIRTGTGQQMAEWLPVVEKTMGLSAQYENMQRQKEAYLQEETKRRQREEKIDRYLDLMIADMTLEQKISQLMILTNPRDITEENLRKYQPGGIILFGVDFEGKSSKEVSEKVETLQSYMQYPLLVGVDEEGGDVSRIEGLTDQDRPVFRSARQLGKLDVEAIRQECEQKMQYLKQMGINLNFDPVADVVTDSDAYMFERSAGSDADTVCAYVTTIVEKMREENVISCLKHFPGYGNNGNTHRYYVKDKRKLKTYEKQDFLPFQAGVAAGADMVMVSHLVMKAVDGKRPASLSKKVHRLLREELHYDGIVIADDLNMQAILSKMTMEKASAKALEAGNDMIFSADLEASFAGIYKAVEDGRITTEQLEKSVKKVLRLKVDHAIILLQLEEEE